jgi:hypothetical protein
VPVSCFAMSNDYPRRSFGPSTKAVDCAIATRLSM